MRRLLKVTLGALCSTLVSTAAWAQVGSTGQTGAGAPQGSGADQGQSGAPSPDKAQQGQMGQPGQQASSADQTFLDRAARINQQEIELGKLAQKKGSSQAIKDLGKRMEQDHTAAQNELKQIAQQNQMKFSSDLTGDERDRINALKQLNGQQFDHAFLNTLMMGHMRAIQTFEDERQDGQNPALKSYADKVLPQLKEHRKTVQQTMQSQPM
jgi:putative membrane protein